MVLLIGTPARQECPCDPRHFVCQRDGDYVCWPSLNQVLTPFALVLSSGDHCSRAMNQKRAHIRISSFADSAQTHLPAGATLLRHQSKEGGQFASRSKARPRVGAQHKGSGTRYGEVNTTGRRRCRRPCVCGRHIARFPVRFSRRSRPARLVNFKSISEKWTTLCQSKTS
jgi:hypothetical protein